MNQIIDKIYIGDAADAQNREVLAIVEAVVNATSQSDNLSGSGIPYLRLDHDDGVPWPAEKLTAFLAFMISTVPTQKVLIHCAAGVSRAPSLVITWLMRAGFSWEEAEALVRAKRPQIAPNPALKDSILEFLGGRDG